MEDVEGRVAVVTGAGSGIGLATAHLLADEGMDLVLADIEEGALAAAEATIESKGAKVLAVRTDVMVEADVNRLADAAFDLFGRPTDVSALRPDLQRFAAGFEAALRGGYPPEVVAEHVLSGIRDDRFYILPAQPEILERVDVRLTDILERRNPTPR